jgi:hypothetical protein
VFDPAILDGVSKADEIVVSGAREHNLKNVSLTIPRDALVVLTGLSGSGKSSLAFDTIYAEGRRRYVESLSVHARRFLDQIPEPDVDSIEGLSPAIAIDQGTTTSTPRSTRLLPASGRRGPLRRLARVDSFVTRARRRCVLRSATTGAGSSAGICSPAA